MNDELTPAERIKQEWIDRRRPTAQSLRMRLLELDNEIQIHESKIHDLYTEMEEIDSLLRSIS